MGASFAKFLASPLWTISAAKTLVTLRISMKESRNAMENDLII